MSLWTEYKAFLTKSNALALAVGIIIGVALGAVVNSLVNDIIMPVVGYMLGGVDFSRVQDRARAGDADKRRGLDQLRPVHQHLIAFVVIAFVAFAMTRLLLPKPVPGPDTKTCPHCGENVLATAKRCKYCTSDLAA